MLEASGRRVSLGADPPGEELARLWQRFATVPPDEAAVLVNREIFGRPCTAAMLPALEEAWREFEPDLVVREPCEYASAIAAGRHDVPHAQVAISPAEVEWSALTLAAPALEAYGDRIVEGLRAAPYLSRFPASLDPSPFPDTRRFRAVADEDHEPLGDFWGGSDAPLVYVTFGSVTGGLPIAAETYRCSLEALAPLEVRVLLTAGHATDVGALGPIPANAHVDPWVPQDRVRRHVAAVVCHGGSRTTIGALSAGVPLVVVPLFADQPVNARRVAEAGAGLVVAPDLGPAGEMAALGPGDVPRLRAAVESVLADPSYRASAGRVADEMRAAPAVGELLAIVEEKLRLRLEL